MVMSIKHLTTIATIMVSMIALWSFSQMDLYALNPEYDLNNDSMYNATELQNAIVGESAKVRESYQIGQQEQQTADNNYV